MPPVRRLTAILAADVAGYSRLMSEDEEGTHERLRAHLGELVEPKIAVHRGRIVKNTGDGLLAEFQSVVGPPCAAPARQREMPARRRALAAASATDYPTRPSGLASLGRDHQRSRSREPKCNSWELLAPSRDRY